MKRNAFTNDDGIAKGKQQQQQQKAFQLRREKNLNQKWENARTRNKGQPNIYVFICIQTVKQSDEYNDDIQNAKESEDVHCTVFV